MTPHQWMFQSRRQGWRTIKKKKTNVWIAKWQCQSCQSVCRVATPTATLIGLSGSPSASRDMQRDQIYVDCDRQIVREIQNC